MKKLVYVCIFADEHITYPIYPTVPP